MSKVEHFEDLIAWQRARILARTIYEVTRDGKLARDRDLSRQIQRAAVSIMSNIAEGFERSNIGDYHRSLLIAKASCGEVPSQLYLAFDIGYVTQNDFNRLLQDTVEVSRIVGALCASVERRRNDSNSTRR